MTVYPQWRCNLLNEGFHDAHDAWEAAGEPHEGPEWDALLNALHAYDLGKCELHEDFPDGPEL